MDEIKRESFITHIPKPRDTGFDYIETTFGGKLFYFDGVLHRENYPAVELPDGEKQWFSHGKLHRDNGPAVERANGSKTWMVNGKLHREDGPAIEYQDGSGYWYVNNRQLAADEIKALKKTLESPQPKNGRKARI